MSELMVLGFENEVEADRFGVVLAQMQKDINSRPGPQAAYPMA